MKWKNRLTNYNFWISMASAGLLILRAFDIKMDIANINEIVTAVLGLLVMIGIINDPTNSAKTTSTEQKTEQTNTSELPIDQKDEDDSVFGENTLQMLIEQISKDIKSTTEKLNNIAEKQNDLNLKVETANIEQDNQTTEQICNENTDFNVVEEERTINSLPIGEEAEQDCVTSEICNLGQDVIAQTPESEQVENKVEEIEKLNCFNIVN